MLRSVMKHPCEIVLLCGVICYALFFSWFTVLRHQTLNSHYYDLGIMNQVVYNTSRGRILQMTDFDTGKTVSRISVHNDLLLSLIAPLYALHAGPETLLVLQSVGLALGAIALYKIAQMILSKKSHALLFALLYLLYPPLQWTNVYDFHAVTLATPLLFFFIYCVMKKKYMLSLPFLLLALMGKEHVGITVGAFLCVSICVRMRRGFTALTRKKIHTLLDEQKVLLVFLTLSFIWSVFSFVVLVPHFRGDSHFALSRYSHLGNTPGEVLATFITNPAHIVRLTFGRSVFEYYHLLLSPLSLLSLLSPLYLLSTIPELAINLLSSQTAMRSIYYQYTALITPFVFLSALYGFRCAEKRVPAFSLMVLLVTSTLVMSYFFSPLPYSQQSPKALFAPHVVYQERVREWVEALKDENISVMASGSIAPHFSSRKTILRFSPLYRMADYVILLRGEALGDWYRTEENRNAYFSLTADKCFERREKRIDFEVYKRLKNCVIMGE